MSVCQVLTKNMETTSNITTERTEFREQLQRNREMNKEQRYAKGEKEPKPYCQLCKCYGQREEAMFPKPRGQDSPVEAGGCQAAGGATGEIQSLHKMPPVAEQEGER